MSIPSPPETHRNQDGSDGTTQQRSTDQVDLGPKAYVDSSVESLMQIPATIRMIVKEPEERPPSVVVDEPTCQKWRRDADNAHAAGGEGNRHGDRLRRVDVANE
ncbi:hypothetical protein GS532_08010 [Rhodococcus hoagii]|nr:hypothetical protein [Prescottella equi]